MKPLDPVTTVAQLDTLPVGAIVRIAAYLHPIVKHPDGWRLAAIPWAWHQGAIHQFKPALIWHPEWASK